MRSSAFLMALLWGASVAVVANEQNIARRHPATADVQRVIVKYRAAGDSSKVQAQAAESRDRALTKRVGMQLRQTLEIAPNLQALGVERAPGESVAQVLARLRADPEVEFAEPDQRRYIHAVPNDPLHVNQWFLKAAQPAAIDAQSAWDTTMGSNGIVIAVLDTGVRLDHPDLKRAASGGHLLPGYDFISPESGGTFKTANDGNGRDSDPTDPGDWISDADKASAPFTDCDTTSSSWHGTRVSGILGALTNNGVGVAGINWNAWLLPVRVLGKCGGFDSDVIAGMRWAAGLHVNGVPDNPYPAKIVNMSLGATTPCSASYQAVVNELAARGVLVVVSAGNESGPVDSPANCQGAVGVAGLRHVGTKVGFSSLGPQVALSAPGGNCGEVSGTCAFSLDTTTNSGETTPGLETYTDALNYNIGTSFSAPIVAGIAGLMSAVNHNLGASQLRDRLRLATVAFPRNVVLPDCHVPVDENDIQDSECNCTTSTCGAGMANAKDAVDEALRPIAAIAVPASVTPGGDVVLQGGNSGAACNHDVASYAWAIVEPGSNAPTIVGADTATATVPAPMTGSFTVRLTVTDDAGLQDTADVVVASTSATTSAPASAGPSACPTPITVAQTPTTPTSAQESGGGGGGGGGFDLLTLLGLVSLLALSARTRAFEAVPRRAGPARRASRASMPRAREA